MSLLVSLLFLPSLSTLFFPISLISFTLTAIFLSSPLLISSPIYPIQFLSFPLTFRLIFFPFQSSLISSIPNCPLSLNLLSPPLSSRLSCVPLSSPLLCGCVSSLPPSGQHVFLRPVLVLLLDGACRVRSSHDPGGLRGSHAARPLAGHPEDLEVSVETVVQP